MDSSNTGIDFTNQIIADDSLNLLNQTNMYNGAGVAIGDLNGDSLPDLVLAGNQVPLKAFLNRGNWKFEDITQKSGLISERWTNGISLVDINADGLTDIYVSNSILNTPQQRANEFFIHQGYDAEGYPIYKEEAEKMGLANTGLSTHTAFFDYDKDGDLDAYVLTNTMETFPHNTLRPKKKDGTGKSNDFLYRNNGDGTFTDVSAEAGITIEGYGLGVAITDINRDQWPDIYVSNDFISNDLLWVNQKDGTFKNEVGQYLRHQSQNGMGVDVADFDNNGFADIVVMDMLPEDNLSLKKMLPYENYDRFFMAVNHLGYEPQFVRNTLQYNHGNGQFSEIGQLAGIHDTDWSWAPLFADLDNDGLKDLIITNGYQHNVIDLDYVQFKSDQAGMFGKGKGDLGAKLKQLNDLPSIQKPDYIYHNNGSLKFEDVSEKWGFTEPTISSGVAYGDLDLDGDLDLVVNHINQPVSVFRNHSRETQGGNFLRIDLQGQTGNTWALGSKIWVYTHGQVQYYEHSPYRGFQSTVEPVIHFGLGEDLMADSLVIEWPNGFTQKFENVKAGRIHLTQPETNHPNQNPQNNYPTWLSLAEGELDLKHSENTLVEFKHNSLLPYSLGYKGPCIATGDIDGNGLVDLFFGASLGRQSQVAFQNPDGTFRIDSIAGSEQFEDVQALWFDLDGDQDLDLYVVSGGADGAMSRANFQDRIYLNDGKGHFTHQPDALPTTLNTNCVTAGDFDGDGDLDLFVGGAAKPGSYPFSERSYLLENRSGKFHDITKNLLGMTDLGLVHSALWSDYDQDGLQDLILAGEWISPRIFKQEEGKFSEQTKTAGLAEYTGWWNTIIEADIDRDGDPDYIAGNLGLNQRYDASLETPLMIDAKDFDENGAVDPILSYYIQGKAYPAHPKAALIKQMAGLRKFYLHYDDYARADYQDFMSILRPEGKFHGEAKHLASSLIINRGNGSFEVKALPLEAQFSPIESILFYDINHDGFEDIIAAGNRYSAETNGGWYDASLGVILSGDGKGNFTPVPAYQSGFSSRQDARSLVILPIGKEGKPMLIQGNNNSPVECWEIVLNDS